ncbi:hypothetical protein GYMLUDRAFT_65479 [Collybiopsis luxurians FD-317 M1]|uniref:Uncharacterized protein n=1 Tax=Collybiopsis luxurians FD-317 M1 TaxID=944289 RepID=A0A0D0C5B3_9AGAR|nr:hypothetical protein GYMLUDRAFT_65479 [Collybiopsis luxurians FD-317 M1]
MQQILQCKLQNQYISPKKGTTSYVATLDDDREMEVPEQPKGVLMKGEYIDINNLRPDSNEMFDILLKDENRMKAGSVVHRDVVECFKQDKLDSDQRRNMTIVANTNNGL